MKIKINIFIWYRNVELAIVVPFVLFLAKFRYFLTNKLGKFGGGRKQILDVNSILFSFLFKISLNFRYENNGRKTLHCNKVLLFVIKTMFNILIFLASLWKYLIEWYKDPDIKYWSLHTQYYLSIYKSLPSRCNFGKCEYHNTLTASTLITLFSEMRKFSKKIFFRAQTFVKENTESFRLFQNVLVLNM